MTSIIIFVLVGGGIFFTRKIWAKQIVLLFKKGEAKSLVISDQQERSIFSPKGTVRTFVIGIEIAEQGDGSAKITVAKLKE